MSGTIIFVSWTSWISQCSLVAILTKFFLIWSGSRVSYQKMDSQELLKKVHRWQSRDQRSLQLQSRDQWIWCLTASWVRGTLLHQNLSDSNHLVNARVEQGGVSSRVGELTRDTSQNPAEQCQVRQQEDTQNPRTQEASGKGCEVWRHTRTGQRWSFTKCKSQTIGSWKKSLPQLPKRNWETMRIPHNLQMNQYRPLYWCGDCLCHRQWKRQWKWPCMLNQFTMIIWKDTRKQLGGNSEFIRFHSEVDIGALWGDLQRETNWKCSSLMEDIYIVSWSSHQVDKSKSTCLLRFCYQPGEDVWAQRSKPKMGRSSGRFSIDRFLRRITGKRWRTDWVRVEYFPRIYIRGDSS